MLTSFRTNFVISGFLLLLHEMVIKDEDKKLTIESDCKVFRWC